MAPEPLTPDDDMARVEVVVARYREPSEPWIRALASKGWRVRVYDKGGGIALDDCGGSVECVACENVGREAETWLRHARDRYDALADLTLFLQGSPFDHLGIRCGDADALHAILDGTVRAWLDAKDAPTRALTFRGSRTVSEDEGHLKLPVGACHRLMLATPDDVPTPTRWTFSAGAQYAVPRAVIRAHPQSAYARWQTLSAATPFLSWNSVTAMPDSVDPWTLERLWPSLWSSVV